MKKKEPTPHQEGLHIVQRTAHVSARIGCGKEDRITCLVMDGDVIVAEFQGATSPQRAAECLAMAEKQKAKGMSITPPPKCVADGARVRAKPTGPMLPWGGVQSKA